MTTAAIVPVSEYLRTSYRPDAEYVDGYIEERFMGERDHSGLQKKLILLLSALELQGNFVCYPELRVQVSETRYRIPDVCLLRADAPWENIVLTPPLLCIEVLSPEDTMSRTLVRVRDFLLMACQRSGSSIRRAGRSKCVVAANRRDIGRFLQIPETSVSLSLSEVLSILN